jgi:Carboxypeptidase regulatory-like domain
MWAIVQTHWFQTRLQRSELPASYSTSLWLEFSMETEARHTAVRDAWRAYLAGDGHRTNVDSTDIPPLIESAEVTLRGTVIDESNRKRVAGAAVTVAPAGVQFTIPITVDSAGRFAVRLRQPGLYTFITRRGGFNDGRVNLTLPIPTNAEIEISIAPTESRTVCLDYCPIAGHVQIRHTPN